ncbi:MAG: polyphosphate kinase 1 [Deltaproteobacteria bacterium]|nr:polyphosphate kinase 1 [Deltaproteobacteria bacterium]
MTTPLDLGDPSLYLNRELSWLEFNARVLAEAAEVESPLYERLKFLCISATNLDEFFMVRVAGLKQRVALGLGEPAPDGMPPAEQLRAISERVHAMVESQYRLLTDELRPALTAAGVRILSHQALTPEQQRAARAHFERAVFPVLTPLAVDPAHPFPHLRNKALNVAVVLRREGRRRRRDAPGDLFAVIEVPAISGRLVPLPSDDGLAFLLLEDLILAHASELYPGFVLAESTCFRVTRNWDLHIDEEESADLLASIEEDLRRRERGAAVRLEIDAAASPGIAARITGPLGLGAADVYRIPGPVHLADLRALSEVDRRPELRVEPLVPRIPASLRDADSLFPVIAAGDVLLHHPYESFDPVVRFLAEASEDPDVLAIKQTLYRTSGDSPIARVLQRAAENGKQVAALVELRARFDEPNNIAWARRLEESGVHVVYGLIGLKTHCKMALVVRREGGRLRRYVHLGTGNYNPLTARQYTDVSLFTAREELADDATSLFNMLTGYSEVRQWKRFAVAPFHLAERVIGLIRDEAERARRGEPARIVAQMNALVDPETISALYAASQAGVEIDLIVRGICCLRPGIPGISERIRVVSIVDRFLEHSRILVFGTGDRTEVYASSADWMPRNFRGRVEILFPIEDPVARARLRDDLELKLTDTVKARRLTAAGTYVSPPATGPRLRSQVALVEAARRAAEHRVDPQLRYPTRSELPKPSAN